MRLWSKVKAELRGLVGGSEEVIKICSWRLWFDSTRAEIVGIKIEGRRVILVRDFFLDEVEGILPSLFGSCLCFH